MQYIHIRAAHTIVVRHQQEQVFNQQNKQKDTTT